MMKVYSRCRVHFWDNHSHLGCVWTFLLVLSGHWVFCEISWKRFPLSSVLWLKQTPQTWPRNNSAKSTIDSSRKLRLQGRAGLRSESNVVSYSIYIYMNPPNREPHPCVHISNYLKVVNSKSFLWGYFALAWFLSNKLTPHSTKPSGHDALWVFSHGCWAKKFKYRVKRDLGFSMWKHTFLTTPTAINKHDLVHIVLLTILGGHSNSFNWMTCLGQPTMLGLWVSASRHSRKQTATERPTKLDTSFQLKIIIYCGWKKSCTSWYMVYPIICRVSSIQGGAGFLPSTCHIWGFTPQPRQFSNHQQQGSK